MDGGDLVYFVVCFDLVVVYEVVLFVVDYVDFVVCLLEGVLEVFVVFGDELVWVVG